jgi:hypothetical protein
MAVVDGNISVIEDRSRKLYELYFDANNSPQAALF